MIRELIDTEVEAVVGGGSFNNSFNGGFSVFNDFHPSATSNGGNATANGNGNATAGPSIAANVLNGGQAIQLNF
jgi:hypothetical protein